MAEKKVSLDICTEDGNFLATPPGSFQGPPIVRSNEARNDNVPLAMRESPTHMQLTNCSGDWVRLFRHSPEITSFCPIAGFVVFLRLRVRVR